MDKQDVKLYAEIKGERHEITALAIDKAHWQARVAVKQGEPFIRWTHGGWAHDSIGLVSLSAIRDEFGRVIPIEADRLAKLGVPVEFHTNIVRQEAGV